MKMRFCLMMLLSSTLAATIPLHEAVKTNNVEWVRALVLYCSRCPINDCDQYGCSALHIAVRDKNKDMIQELLGHNIDTEIRNNRGETAYEYAKRKELVEIQAIFNHHDELLIAGMLPPPLIDVSYDLNHVSVDNTQPTFPESDK